jgi:hypothetical protein
MFVPAKLCIALRGAFPAFACLFELQTIARVAEKMNAGPNIRIEIEQFYE